MKSKHTSKHGAKRAADREEVVMTVEQINDAIARGEDRTDWARIDAMTQAEVEANALSDADNPPITAKMLATATLMMPSSELKTAISFRIDPDVLDFFKRTGKGYQGRMNAVLRAWMHTHQQSR